MKKYIAAIIIILFSMSCRKPYNPPAISAPSSYPVIEGTINTVGVTTIKLSQTVSLSSTAANKAITGASLAILSSQSGSYPLTEVQPGKYQSASLSLDNSLQYRLSIKTSTGEQYLSDLEPVTVSPPIDSVGYTITGNGLSLYVNTHDPTNATKYYRWDYNETWQFHSMYSSSYETNGTAIVERTPAQQVYFCFATDTGSNIVLANTAHLSQSVISQQQLTTVGSTSEKLELEYSIQVNQYALSADAYNFWNNLKENSENLGSIFDPLPSEIPGNIHDSKNAASPVIGYVSVCAVQTKRIFVYKQALPTAWLATYPYAGCQIDSEYFYNPKTKLPDVELNLIPVASPDIPIDAFTTPQGTILGYTAADYPCVDCTIRGTTAVPIYWQ